MSHEITVGSNGVAEAAYSITPAWHGLGIVFDNVMTSEEACRSANLGWEVEKVPVWIEGTTNGFEKIPRYMMNVRSDNGFQLGMVGKNHRNIQNTEAFSLLDSLVMDGILNYESAFSLNGGRDVVLLARMPDIDEVVEGDISRRYLMCSLNHSGRECDIWTPTNMRAVCANTRRIAILGATQDEIIKVRHSGDVDQKLSDVRERLIKINKAFGDSNEVAKKLAATPVVPQEFEDFLNKMVPVPSIWERDYSNRKRKVAEDNRELIRWNFNESPAQSIRGMSRSAWAAYNSLTQWVDHREYKGKTTRNKAETRFKVSQTGTGNELKVRAWNYFATGVTPN